MKLLRASDVTNTVSLTRQLQQQTSYLWYFHQKQRWSLPSSLTLSDGVIKQMLYNQLLYEV